MLSLIEHTRGEHSVRDNSFIKFCCYDARACGICAVKGNDLTQKESPCSKPNIRQLL